MDLHQDPGSASNGEPVIPLPPWAKLKLTKFNCSICGRTQSHSDIVATGIRSGPNGRGVFFLESICGQCHTPAVCMFAGLPFDPQTFAIGLTLAYRNGLAERKPVDAMFQNWTDHASEAVADELESCGSHSDFLRRIGLTEEQIGQWATYRRPARDDACDGNLDSIKE